MEDLALYQMLTSLLQQIADLRVEQSQWSGDFDARLKAQRDNIGRSDGCIIHSEKLVSLEARLNGLERAAETAEKKAIHTERGTKKNVYVVWAAFITAVGTLGAVVLQFFTP